MPLTPQAFQDRIDALRSDIVLQGRSVQRMVEASFNAVFARDVDAAKVAIALDEDIDATDVQIEKQAVALLVDACKSGANIDEPQVRMLLTIVKVNNELERIADVGVSIAEQAALFKACASLSDTPPTFRVLANSCVGILRDSVRSLERLDPHLAKVVLMSETCVGQFKQALISDIQRQVAKGTMPLDTASTLHDTAMYCVNAADHCTNICEQVMYVATGTIFRHMEGKWEQVHVKP